MPKIVPPHLLPRSLAVSSAKSAQRPERLAGKMHTLVAQCGTDFQLEDRRPIICVYCRVSRLHIARQYVPGVGAGAIFKHIVLWSELYSIEN